MALKSWDEREDVHDYSYNSSGTITDRIMRLGKWGQADAVFSRPKPVPLTPTNLTLRLRHDRYGGWYYDCKWSGITSRGSRQFAKRGYVRSEPRVEIDGKIALTKARDAMSGYSFGEALGELNQSTDMILKRLGQILLFAKRVRTGRFKEAGMRKPSKKVLQTPGSKRLADNWLELQYGWLPLISDIYDVIDAVGSGMARRGMKVSKKSSEVVRQGALQTPVTSRAGFSGVVSNEAAFNLNQWGLLNPANIAWNLVPFTFVIDWFLPIGRTLGALTGTAGLSQVMGWYVDIVSLESTGVDQTCSEGGRWLHTQYLDAYRRVEPFWFVPVLYARQGALNAGRVANAVALIRQSVR